MPNINVRVDTWATLLVADPRQSEPGVAALLRGRIAGLTRLPVALEDVLIGGYEFHVGSVRHVADELPELRLSYHGQIPPDEIRDVLIAEHRWNWLEDWERLQQGEGISVRQEQDNRCRQIAALAYGIPVTAVRSAQVLLARYATWGMPYLAAWAEPDSHRAWFELRAKILRNHPSFEQYRSLE